jgi:replicative DNA helicase
VFVRIQEALVTGSPTDAASIAIALQGSGKAWGPKFVDELDGMDVLPSHAEHYLDELADAYHRRQFHQAADETQKALDEGLESADTATARLSEKLAALQRWKARETQKTGAQIRAERVEVFHQAADDRAAGRPVRTRGLSWGIPTLDMVTDGIFPGLNVVAARPSFGKTMLENWISCHLLARGYSVARACIDMTQEDLADRALTLLSGETLSKLVNGFMMPSDEAKLRAAAEATGVWKEHLINSRVAEEIVSRARAIKSADGLDLLTVDYIQQVHLADESHFMTDNMLISRTTAILKDFAVSTGTPVVLLSQLSRAVEKEDREPQLSDLRDSGSIEQEAKTVCFIYPEPAVIRAWQTDRGASDWKELPIRPGVINCLKSQYGRTGCIGIRQFAKYGIYEACRRVTKDEAAEHRIAREKANLKAFNGHRRAETVVPAHFARGFDYSCAAQGCEYIVAKHPEGAYEVFDAVFFDSINEAAVRIGQKPWANLEVVSGLVPALGRRSALRREHNQFDDPENGEIIDAATPRPPPPRVTDPDSPFYEGGNPDPDTEVEP